MGIKGQACRKSVRALLEKMVSDGLIKSFEIVMPSGNSTTSFIYYCDAKITMENDIFKTAVSETKFRLKTLGKNKPFSQLYLVIKMLYCILKSLKCDFSNDMQLQHSAKIFKRVGVKLYYSFHAMKRLGMNFGWGFCCKSAVVIYCHLD